MIDESTLTRRQIYTVHVIWEAYLDLLEILPEDKVRITDLCERADVNRTTFYRYYTDLDALRRDVRESFFHQLFSVMAFPEAQDSASVLTPRTPDSFSTRARISKALTAVLKNRRICRLLVVENDSDVITRQLEANLLIFRETILSTGCSEETANLYYAFFCGGMSRVLIQWILDDFAVPKEKTAAIIESFINNYYTLLSGNALPGTKP